MKILAVTLGLLAFSGVEAADHLVLETPSSFWDSQYRAKFEVNKEQGRAWVTLVTTERHGGSHRDRFERETRAKVPGLSFDSSTSTIVYDTEGALLECATVRTRGRSIFRHNKITPTGCRLKVVETRKPIDDGYRTRMQNVTQVYLITK